MNVALGFGLPGATFPGTFAAPQVPDKKNFAPRISFAYTPHWGRFLLGENKTVFRGAGYGIFYDGMFSNIIDNTAESQPNTLGAAVFLSKGGKGRRWHLLSRGSQPRRIHSLSSPQWLPISTIQ